MKFLSRFCISLLIVFGISFIALFLYNTYENIDISSNYTSEKVLSSYEEQTIQNVTENSKTISNVIEEVSSCVVGISRLKNNGGSIFSNRTETELGLGTGIIVSENGYILSNSHVTGEKLSSCYITLENGITYDGNVVWSSNDLDLSITKIKASGLKFATLGDSKSLKPGETVYAIGNPIGFEFRRTVTSGIISAINRTIRIDENNMTSYMTDLIQTDASINSGNSGGPLILPNGDIIGINTIKITSAEGIGFAVPINVVKPIIESFIVTDNFNETQIGIYGYDKDIVKYIASVPNFSTGIFVASILPNTSASNSSLQVGDIITSIDNIEINTMNELKEYIFSKSPGDTVTLTISRGYISLDIDIPLSLKK